MDNQPTFNRDLIIPIIIGGISVIGIILILLIGRALSAPAEIPMTPSATPFDFLFLGTEPAITTPLVEGSEIAALPEEPQDSPGPNPVLASPTSGSAPTPNILPQLNRTNTATALVLRTNTPGGAATSSGGGQPTTTSNAAPGSIIYDDTDTRFSYVGTWVSQTNVPGAHQGTLHISNTIGDTLTFSFTGQQIRVVYQAGPSLGSVLITIDGAGPPQFSQAETDTQFKEWVYQSDTAGTHNVEFFHFGGGSVNIDSIIVQGATPTPTRTPTSTPTQ